MLKEEPAAYSAGQNFTTKTKLQRWHKIATVTQVSGLFISRPFWANFRRSYPVPIWPDQEPLTRKRWLQEYVINKPENYKQTKSKKWKIVIDWLIRIPLNDALLAIMHGYDNGAPCLNASVMNSSAKAWFCSSLSLSRSSCQECSTLPPPLG